MNFIEFYKSLSDKLEKRKVRNKIVEACRIQPSTFYSWLQRGKIPPLTQEKIAEILEIPQGQLFPEEEDRVINLKKMNNGKY